MANTSQETTAKSSKENNWDNFLLFLKYAIPVSVSITLMLELIVVLVSDRNGTGFVSRLTMDVVIFLEVLSVAWWGVVSGFALLTFIVALIRELLRLFSIRIPALRVSLSPKDLNRTQTKAKSKGRLYSAFVFFVLPFIMILNGAIYAREANSPVAQGALEQFYGKGETGEGDNGKGGKWGMPIRTMILAEIFGIAAPTALLLAAFISSMLQKRSPKKTKDLEAVSAGPEEEPMIMMEATKGSDTAVVPGKDDRTRDSGETMV